MAEKCETGHGESPVSRVVIDIFDDDDDSDDLMIISEKASKFIKGETIEAAILHDVIDVAYDDNSNDVVIIAEKVDKSSNHANFKDEILKKFESFKQFDIVGDTSDHIFVRRKYLLKEDGSHEGCHHWSEGTPFHDDLYLPDDFPNVLVSIQGLVLTAEPFFNMSSVYVSDSEAGKIMSRKHRNREETLEGLNYSEGSSSGRLLMHIAGDFNAVISTNEIKGNDIDREEADSIEFYYRKDSSLIGV
ncbi:hypothetical protein L195_g023545 [Trifolium pratense]|uniref:Uncharacterized protein n=1 Tax=Trifolium pratense TaxID=57577 RepID=A0A2K3NB57_TRIPR|nr:hypothetical protein L195_g023545 [Trifolium pratense]